MRSKLFYTFYLFFCLLIAVAGISFFYVSSLPFSKIKAYLDSLTVDGNVESYTEALHQSLFIKYRYLSFVVSASGVFLFFFRKKLTATIMDQVRHISIYTKDGAHCVFTLFRSEEKTTKIFLILIFITGVALRIKQLAAPLIYDEAFTHISYVIKPLFISLSDYSYPNNHLFHTFLAHASWRIFGEHPWALRLPAFVAGLLVIPAGWLLAKKIAGSGAGLMAAALIVAFPEMIYYSGIARGYSLIMVLFILSLLIVADPVFIKRRGALAWLFIFSVLGFYTIPTFIYPYITMMCCATLIVSRNKNPSLFIRLLFFNLFVFGFTFLCYLPVFLVSGIGSVIGNEYVAAVSYLDLGPVLWLSAYKTLIEWTVSVSPFVASALAAFALYCFRKRSLLIALAASALVVLGFVFIHPAIPPPRVWSFLLPVILILTSVGGSALVSFFFLKNVFQKAGLLFLVGVFLFSFSSGWNRNPFNLETTDNEAVVLYLKKELRDGDQFLADIPFDYPIECYMREHNVPVKFLREKSWDSKRIIFILNKGLKQKMYEVVARLKIDTTAYSPPVEIAAFNFSTLYEMKRNSPIAE